MAKARAKGARFTWTYDSFVEFYLLLTLPEGGPTGLEGFQRLILREIFATGRVELLVLIPKGHAKTTLMAALAVFHLLVTRNANVYIGAADKGQADEMYRFAAHFIESEPDLSALAKVLHGTRRIVSRRDQGFILVLASDDSQQGGKKQGFNPTLAFLDELHAHENDNLYTDMRSGLFKRHGILVTITTAGWDLDGVLGKLRAGFLGCTDIRRGLVATAAGDVKRDAAGRLTFARKPTGNSAMLEWALTADDDPDDLAVVKLANPATWVTLAGLVDAKESLTPWTFRRYRCNLWTLGFESWLPVDAWDLLAFPAVTLDPSLPTFAAIDAARYRDCAALVAVQPRQGLPWLVKAWIRRSGGVDDPISYGDMKQDIRDLDAVTVLVAVGFDPKYFDQSAEELGDEGIAMELFAQSNERMCPAADQLRQAILSGGLVHDGDPVLAAHVAAPVAKEVGDSMFKLVKARRNAPPIDGCVALAMARALAAAGTPEVSAEVW